MRRVSHTSTKQGDGRQGDARQAPGIGRLSRRWLMAAVITGAVAVLAPGVRYVTASPPTPAAHPQVATLAAQNGTDQNGTDQNGTAQNGTAQNGTARNGTSQTQAPTPQAGAAAAPGCLGVTPAIFPPRGFIANPNRGQGGHLWWRFAGDGTSVCIGTVVEFVQYNVTATKTWRVIVYTTQNPGGVTVAMRTFTLNRGDYFWGFGLHRVFSGLTAVCLTADDSFGMSCVHFG